MFLLLCSIVDFSRARCTLIIFRLFLSSPCFEDSIHARTELVTLGVAELSSIMLITHSFVIPVIKTLLRYNCISGVPWGSSVFLAVPGPTVFFHHPQDSLILAYFHHPHSHFYHLHCSQYMSWQKYQSYHPHLNPCHSCTHLHNDPAFHT